MDGPRRADLSRSGRIQSHESAPLRPTREAQVEDAAYTDKENGYSEQVGSSDVSAFVASDTRR